MRSLQQKVALGVGGGLIVVALVASGSLFESLDAGQLMVIQAPLSDTLTWHTSPGVKGQWFGKVTKYQKREQFWFSTKTDQGTKSDQSMTRLMLRRLTAT